MKTNLRLASALAALLILTVTHVSAQEVRQALADTFDIVRQSTGVLASDSVKLVRVRTMNGDVLLSRFIDRILHRSEPRYPELRPVAPAEVAS